MNTFFQFLEQQNNTTVLASRLRLLESYFNLPSQAYNDLFEKELHGLTDRFSDDSLKREFAVLKGFNWTGYIAAAVRGSGISDNRHVQETTHDIVSKLLTGKLFRGYDPLRHGPIEKRFKRSVGNAVRNIAEKSRNQRKYFPSSTFDTNQLTARQGGQDVDDLVSQFRHLVSQRLGSLALQILDTRLNGDENEVANQQS